MPERKSKKSNNKRIAFVISPIGDPDSPERKRVNQILNHVIIPIASECGYETIRADQISKPGIITSQIINHIMSDSLVIADLTGHNPNVFYELAIRHAIKKPVIQMIRKGEKIPFDVSTQRTIQIDHQDLDSVEEAKKELLKQIEALEQDPKLVESPISIAVNFQSLKQSGDPQRKAIAELRAILQDNSLMVRETYRKMEELTKGFPVPSIVWGSMQERAKGTRLWVKLDETLPWIELKGTYETPEEIQKAVKKFVSEMEIRVVQIPSRSTKSPRKKKG